MYKVDNTLIFVQTIYFFIYTKAITVPLMPSFYYGWSMSHFNFISNLLEKIIP